MVGSAQWREIVQWAQAGWRLSVRRACTVFGIARSVIQYRPTPRPREARSTPLLPPLARQLPRFGYRRIREVLCTTWEPISRKAVQRLWQLLALQVKPRKRIRRRRPVGLPVRNLQAQHANHVWCMDFLKDTTRDRRPLRILSVVDEHTRECLALLVARRFFAVDVVRALNRVRWLRGNPGHLRSDNGPEFVATSVASWATEREIQLVHTAPGSPWENAFSETFHSRLRDECLEREVLGSVEEAQVVCEAYRQWYNQVRPHSALRYQTPAAFAAGTITMKVARLQVAGVPA